LRRATPFSSRKCEWLSITNLFSQALSRLATLWLEVGRPAAAVEALEALEGLSKTLSGAERGQLAARLRAGRAAAAAPPRPDHYRLLGLQRSATADDVRPQFFLQLPSQHNEQSRSRALVAASHGLLPLPCRSWLERM